MPLPNDTSPSSNQRRCGAGIILEVGLNDLLGLVIPRQSVNTTLDENKAEFRVFVFSVDIEMFADRDSFFDEVVEVFRDGGCKAVALQHSEDLVSGDKAHLGNSMRVTEGDTDLGWGETFAGEFDDMFDDFVGGRLEP